MSDLLQLVLVLALLIGTAKVFGALSARIGQPAVLGELLAGLLLGPSVVDLLHLPVFTSGHLETTVIEIAELGVIFLMFIAGLEIDLDELRRAGTIATVAGVMGVIVPLLLGFLAALPFGFPPSQALFIGVLLTATSVSISAQTLLELGKLRTRVGAVLLGAAVIDDVLVIILLSVVVAALTGAGSGALGLLFTIGRMALFLVGATLIGARLVPWLADRAERVRISQPVLSAAVVTMLLLAWGAEALGGVAAITGAFLAGILFARTRHGHEIGERLNGLAYAFLVPVFFTSIGLRTDVTLLSGNLIWLTLVICAVAVFSKIIGCGLGARLAGMDSRGALQVGVGMISRGEVGLIVATVGISSGVIGQEVFAVTVVMVLVTTLVTPPLLRLVLREPRPAEPAAAPLSDAGAE
jgi:Kef-type K+ transport system membrane component KefB